MGNQEGKLSENAGEVIENDIKVRWKKMCASPFQPRDGHSSAVVGSCLYVFGGLIRDAEGRFQESSELMVFDFDKEAWSCVEKSENDPAPRVYSSMASIGDELYMFGGFSNDSGWFNDLHTYNTVTKQWKLIGEGQTRPCVRDKAALVAVDSKLFMFGGFGPKEGEFLSDEDDDEASEEEEEQAPKAVRFGWYNDMWVFEKATMSWQECAHTSSPSERAAHAMCAIDKLILVFGGRDCKARCNDLHAFDTDTGKWLEGFAMKGRIPSERSFHSMTAIGNKRALVFGGRHNNNDHSNDLHILDTESREWLQPSVANHHEEAPPRGMHSAHTLSENFVIFGGSDKYHQQEMQCHSVFNDMHALSQGDLLSGGRIESTSPDSGNEAA